MITNGLLTAPGLQIKAASKPDVESANAIEFVLNGVQLSKSAGDMPALTGTIADDYKAVYVFTVNASGTLAVYKGDDVAIAADFNIAKEVVQAVGGSNAEPRDEVIVGFITVDNQTGSTFTGDTTDLDTANLTVKYFDAFGLVQQN